MKNPYREGSPCWLAWEQGYNTAIKDAIEKLKGAENDGEQDNEEERAD